MLSRMMDMGKLREGKGWWKLLRVIDKEADDAGLCGGFVFLSNEHIHGEDDKDTNK